MPTEDLQKLLTAYVTGSLDIDGRRQLLSLLKDPAMSEEAEKLLLREWEAGLYDADEAPEVYQRLHAYLNERTREAGEAKVITVSPSRHRWYWAAAIVLALLTAGAYFWFRQDQPRPLAGADKSLQHDIAPGKDGAVLTLADGTQVILDSIGNGVVADQSGAKVILKNGQLAYDPTGTAAGTVAYNIMSTPKGRQFRLVLPDGTQVWLNAASSIVYPTAFTGKERKVQISGEAYFEVAGNSTMPFRVVVNDQTEIQVLGTHFNVNAYGDDKQIRTTLIEGKVKVKHGVYSAILQPGNQALAGNNLTIRKDIDTEQVLAWKNGLFNFNEMDLPSAMHQLARWYDLEVVFEGKIPDKIIRGKMGRDLSWLQVQKVLEMMEVKIRVEGKKLIVLP